MSRPRFNLPRTQAEQKVWMKGLGIKDIRCAKMALVRDHAVDTAIKKLKRRDFKGAVNLIHVADKMQTVIDHTQEMFKVLK
jgi:hypothetical protein